MRVLLLIFLTGFAGFTGCATNAGTIDEDSSALHNSDPTRQTLIENRRLELGKGVGAWAAQPFEIYDAARVDWDLLERTGTGVDVCLIPKSESRSWENGEAVRGWTCHESVQSYSDHVTLNAGDYSLAFRTSHSNGAVVSFSIYASV